MAEQDVKVNITAEDKTDAAFSALNAKLGDLDASFVRLASAAATFAGGAFITAIAASIKAAEDAEIAQRKLEAILRATGNASGFTTQQLGQLAEKLASTSQFDDEQFKEATATLLRFGNIAGENLERVLRLAGDYAALTGGTLTSATEKLARALSDPAEGLKKLERNFGDLSPEIERAIRQKMALGDRSGALGLALDALEQKIGGADANINSGLTGSVRRLSKSLGDLSEVWGSMGQTTVLQSVVDSLDNKLRGLVTMLTDENISKLQLVALFFISPRQFLSTAGAIGGSPVPNVNADSTIRFDAAAFEAELNTTVSAIVNAQQTVTRESLKESERLNAERARMNEQARRQHLRGEEAALEAEHELLNETMRQNAGVRRAAMREAEAIRQLGVKSEEAALMAEHELLQQTMELNYRARVAGNKRQEQLLQDQAKYWQGFLGGIESAFRDIFDKIFRGQINSWSDFVGALRDIFKRVLLDFIYQSLARPFVLQVVASAAGSLGFSGLANAANTAAGGSPLGGFGSSLLGTAATGSGIGFATGAEFFSGMMGSFMGPTLPGSAAAMGAQFAAFMTNPVTLAVLVAVAIAVAVQARRGGPKEGGSFFGNFDGSGRLLGETAVPGYQRFYTPSGGDPFMRQFTEGIGSAFADALTGLGGSGAQFGFGFGYDRDPRGTAPSRVSGIVTDAQGNRIFEVINRDVGRGDEDFQRGLELLGRQSVLGALQNSKLPEAILAILRMVDAASATAEEIDNVFKLAVAFRNLTSTLGEISVTDVVEQMGRTSIEIFQEQGRAMVELAGRTALTTESLATLTAATGAYRTSAIQLIAGLEQASRAIEEMFGQTARNIRMSGMSDAERFRFLQDETTRLLALLSTAGADDISRLSQLINQNIGSAFSLLSPEEQAARRDEFLTRLEEANAAAQERLRTLQQQAAEEANRQLSEVRRIMEEMALSQKSAADTQQDAANKQLAAANTPRTINVKVDLARGGTVVTEGA